MQPQKAVAVGITCPLPAVDMADKIQPYWNGGKGASGSLSVHQWEWCAVRGNAPIKL